MKKKVKEILRLLDENYGPLECYLVHENTWQLLISTILSAQCTDDRVNMVTEKLFKKYTSIEDFAKALPSELEEDIRQTGFYRNKAKNIILCCQSLIENFGGEVPSDIESLTSLAGVGRKTANVIRGNIYAIPSIVVDTHVKRISRHLGLASSEDPVKIEFELMEVLPREHWIRYNTQVIAHGRKICVARRPRCGECFLSPYCDTYKKTGNQNPTVLLK